MDILFRKGAGGRLLAEEFQWLGLMLFVAVLFPGTGAWTGAIIAVRPGHALLVRLVRKLCGSRPGRVAGKLADEPRSQVRHWHWGAPLRCINCHVGTSGYQEIAEYVMMLWVNPRPSVVRCVFV
ncbi:hypothetical protein ZWY2020_018246 [Hordeum vulgare]|nr:hypothetical protein ZWY2020_018246 [Hordeum vulgare]